MSSIADPSLFMPALLVIFLILAVGYMSRSIILASGAGFIVLLYVAVQSSNALLLGFTFIISMFVVMGGAVFLTRLILGDTA